MNALEEVHPSLGPRLLRMFVLAGLLTALGVLCFNLKYGVLDFDVWWHVKVGEWIVQHRSFPHTGIFSRTAAGRPWAAYSWGYEVLLSLAYRWFGLLGIALFGTLLTLAVAFSVFWMLRQLSGRFFISCLLATVTCSAFLFNIRPRPVFFSMILFCATITLLLEANRSGRVQLLFWLPLIFFLWSNFHIQFIYGIFVVGLFVGINLVQRLGAYFGISPAWMLPPTLPSSALVVILVCCLLAPCISPYSFHLYQVVFSYASAKVPYALVSEFQPIDFRSYRHYLQLFLSGAAFFALGWRKKIDLVKLSLLVACTAVAFRTGRDAWFICIPAAACIAEATAYRAKRDYKESLAEIAAVAAVVALSLTLLAPAVEFDTPGIDRTIRRNFPVNAVSFILKNRLPGPLYNTFDWGGFLIFYLPEYPVAIDGRTDLYGDEMDERFAMTARGVPSYVDDPYLNESRVILLQQDNILVKFLVTDPRFELIYQDELAAVFRRR